MSVCRTVTKYHWIVRNASLRAAFATTTSTTSPTTSHSHATSKVVRSAKEALSDCIFPGASINCGGFGLGGVPETLLNELAKTDQASDLTIASLTAGIDGFGLGKLFEAGKVKRMIASYVGENKLFAEMYFGGKIEVELTPQGTIAARMRSAGIGIPGMTYYVTLLHVKLFLKSDGLCRLFVIENIHCILSHLGSLYSHISILYSCGCW
jgi:hypothetical protein